MIVPIAILAFGVSMFALGWVLGRDDLRDHADEEPED